MSPSQVPEPSELIYVPNSSWGPMLVAAAIALILAGMFMGWFLWLLGAIVLLIGGRSWFHQADDEVSRMRREQQVDTAVIPADPIRTGTHRG
jgi:membrane-bound ClpP family serine protease